MRNILPAIAVVVTVLGARAESALGEPSLKLLSNNDIKIDVGARLIADAGVFGSDSTDLTDGAKIADARLRASATYGDWYFYADFGFAGGKFSQKHIYLQYSVADSHSNKHYFRAGYFFDPAGMMSRNLGMNGMHFMSNPGSASALGYGRALGVTYKLDNAHYQIYQGISVENPYNKIDAGGNGLTVSGRYTWRPIATKHETLHIALNARYGHSASGSEQYGQTYKTVTLSQRLETEVDETAFLSASLPWVNNTYDLGGEVLYHDRRIFARGEYRYKHVTKKRDDAAAWASLNADGESVGDFDAWCVANALKSSNFGGGYVEAGYLIFGPGYTYNSADGLLGGFNGRMLEVVGRWSHTDLNSGDRGTVGAVRGGRINSYTVGVNYSFNKYVQLLVNYTYHHLNNDKLPGDRNIHVAQTRLQFTF